MLLSENSEHVFMLRAMELWKDWQETRLERQHGIIKGLCARLRSLNIRIKAMKIN